MLPKYKIFLILLLSFISGIALASFLKISFFICYVLFLLAVLVLFFGWKNGKIRMVGFVLIFIVFGIIRYNLSWPKITADKIQFYNNEKVKIEGMVINVNKKLDKEEIIFKSEKLIKNGTVRKVSGKVLLYMPLYSNYQYGDKLQIFCQLFKPEPIADFAYHEYLAKQDIYSICFPEEVKILERKKGNIFTQIAFEVKNKVKLAIEQNIKEPEGSVLATLLLGIKKEVPSEVRNWFSLTGTAHILAISGLHVSVLAKILLYFAISFLGLARPKAFYFVVLILIFYVLLAGAPASAIRAGMMGFLVLLAEKIGRRSYPLNLIILAAALILLFNPKLLKSDIGFQLSFSTVLGITLLEDYFFSLFNFLKFLPNKLRTIQNYLATTCSAYLFSLPLLLFYFGNLSLVAPIVNVLILPILPLVMGLGFIFAFGTLIYFFLAKILAWPVWLFLHYILWVVKFFARLSFLSFNLGKINFFLVVSLYFLIIVFVIKARQIKILT